MTYLESLNNRSNLIIDTLVATGLNWEVKKVQLQTPEGEKTDFYGTQRQDTKEVFSCVKNGYQVFQNHELVDLVSEVAGHFNLEVVNGGVFNGGRRVFLQIPTGSLKGIGINNDEVKKYITAINSHDGSSSIGFGCANITISCSNTFYQAQRELANKIRHTASMKQRVQALIEEFENLKHAEERLYANFTKFDEAKLNDSKDMERIISRVINIATGVDVDALKKNSDDFSSRAKNNVVKVAERIQHETNQKGESLWGILSGITMYTNKDLSTPNRDNAVLESKMTGSAERIDNKVYNYLTTLI